MEEDKIEKDEKNEEETKEGVKNMEKEDESKQTDVEEKKQKIEKKNEETYISAETTQSEIKEGTEKETKELEEDDAQEKEIQKNEENKEEVNEIKTNEEEQQSNKEKKSIVPVVIITILICLALFFSIIFALININNENILSGISIMNVDVSKLSKEDALKKIDDEIEKAYRASLNSNNNQGGTGAATEFTGGNFAWPAPGYNTITFGFVYYLVNPNGSAHTGCDIAGANIFGKPIVAAESGTVIVAGYNAGGYGNYVMIDHGKCTQDGNNYITLYGHASALAVQKGDKVTKGQTIAYVGSTGNSTGPHLHFEMRINGKITDPLVQYPSLSFDYR